MGIESILQAIHLCLMMPIVVYYAGAVAVFVYLAPSTIMGGFMSIPFLMAVCASLDLSFIKGRLFSLVENIRIRIDCGIVEQDSTQFQQTLGYCMSSLLTAIWAFLVPLKVMSACLAILFFKTPWALLFLLPLVVLFFLSFGLGYVRNLIGYLVIMMRMDELEHRNKQ